LEFLITIRKEEKRKKKNESLTTKKQESGQEFPIPTIEPRRKETKVNRIGTRLASTISFHELEPKPVLFFQLVTIP